MKSLFNLQRSPEAFCEPVEVLSTRRIVYSYIAIFVLALLVRLLFISQFAQVPMQDLIWNDAVGWNLAQGHGFTASQQEPRVPGIFRPPGYPVFLAAVYSVFGHSVGAAFVAQAVIDALAATLVTAIALHFFSPSISFVSGILYAVYPYSAILCGVLAQDILLTFFVLSALLLSLQAKRNHDKPWYWLLAGITLGLAVLVKAFIVLYVLVPIAVMLRRSPSSRPTIGTPLAFCLGMTIVVAPWVVRNYVVFKSFPPLAVGGTGTNMMYLLEELKGGEEQLMRKLKLPRINQSNKVSNATYLDSLVDGAPLIAYEKELSKKAIPEIVKRWPQYIVVVFKHIPRLWLTRYAAGRSQVVNMMGKLVSWIVLLLGMIGMFLLRHQWRHLLPLYLTVFWITLMYAPYTAEARYTLPARPVMMIFISILLSTIVDRYIKTIHRDEIGSMNGEAYVKVVNPNEKRDAFA